MTDTFAPAPTPHPDPTPAQAPRLELAYEVTLDDLVELNMVRQELSPTVKKRMRQLRVTGVIMAVAGLAWAAAASVDVLLGVAPDVVGLAIGLALVIGGLYYVVAAKRIFDSSTRKSTRELWSEAANPSIVGPRRLYVSENGLREISPLTDTTTRWQAVVHVQDAPSLGVVLWTSSLSGVLVPNGAFTTPEWRAYLVQTAEFYQRMYGAPAHTNG